MNFQKYKLDFATLTKGNYLSADTLETLIKPLDMDLFPATDTDYKPDSCLNE
jgi:hypothetical protein